MLNSVFKDNGLEFSMEYNPKLMKYEFEVDVSKLLIKATKDIGEYVNKQNSKQYENTHRLLSPATFKVKESIVTVEEQFENIKRSIGYKIKEEKDDT